MNPEPQNHGVAHYRPSSSLNSALLPFQSDDSADDEQSSSGSSSIVMVPSPTIPPQPIEEHESGLHYAGEDNRPTSSKELLGFYAYSFAAEVFIVCGIGKDCHLYIR